MLTEIPMNQINSYAVEACGKINSSDYQNVLGPHFDEARSQGLKLRFLFHLGDQFEGFTPGAAWEDFKLGLKHFRTLERCAVVTDNEIVRGTSQFVGAMIPCPVKVFHNYELENAKTWLASTSLGLDYFLDQSTGVLRIELSAPLTSEDFKELTHDVDSWLEREGALRAIVVHAAKFPGWENLGSMLSQLEFIRDHHQKIRRVALCVDGELPQILSSLVQHFVAAEFKYFPANSLDEAMNWARSA